MNGILFLNTQDFTIRNGEKGKLLCLQYESNGLTLVLFYSKECKFCDNLINKFKQLPSAIHGCQFAMVNVNRNMDLVEQSKSTIVPLEFVPDVILFVNGLPYMRYDGAHEISAIRDFILHIYKTLEKTMFSPQQQAPSQQQQFGPPNHYLQQHQNVNTPHLNKNASSTENAVIPAYTVGKPLIGDKKRDGVCYLNFKSAYVSTQA